MSVLPPHEVALEIDGEAYLGWTEIAVDRGIDAVAGSFDLTLASKERTGATDWPIAADAECRVLLAGETLVTGHVDAVFRFVDAEERGIRVRGRDRTADLVDCSAIHDPGSWRGKDLQAIAAELAEPFGIEIAIEGDTGAPFARFALQQGETAFAAIERMARYRGLVAWSSGDGRLRIGNPDTGERTGRIEEGRNLIAAEGSADHAERYSDYVLKGQASGSAERAGRAAAQVIARTRDAQVARYRPLLVMGEEQSDTASLQQRAEWEAAVRAGRSQALRATVPGWFEDDGGVWRPGARSACKVPSVDVEGDLLVERVRLVRDGERGTVSDIDLVPPEAWTQLAEPEEEVA